MKLLKQIIIFAVFTAAIWGVFELVSDGKPQANLSALYGSNVDEINNTISADWKNLDGWDAEVYNNEMVMIAQSHTAELINDEARTTLTDRVNTEAYKKCVDAMKHEFAKAGCSNATVTDNYNGLQMVISRQPAIEKLPDVVEMEKVYSLYNRFRTFISRNISLMPHFNSGVHSWDPAFRPFAESLHRTKNELLANPLYSRYLSNISELKRIHQTDAKINSARIGYYNNLYSQISSYFSSRVAEAGDDADLRSELKSSLIAVRSAVINDPESLPEIKTQLRQLYERIF